MSRYKLQDATAAEVKGTRRLAGSGYLVADAYVARTGIQLYRGKEVGRPDLDVVRVYRDEAEVRKPASMKSFSHAPITIGHPPDGVNSKNWKDLAVGEVSTDAVWEGDKIKLPLILKDEAAVGTVFGGTRELSPGYASTIVFEPGVTPQGEPYDAKQTDIVIDHVAIVPRGRSGPQVRIGDAEPGENWGAIPITDAEEETPMTLRTILVDGLSVETTAAGAQAIEKLTAQIASLTAEKDREIAKLTGERDTAQTALADEQKKVLSDEDVNKLVEARAALLARARAIVADAKLAGDEASIRRQAVAAKLGDAAVKDKSDAFIEVRFDDLADAAMKAPKKPDGVLRTIVDNASDTQGGSGGGWDTALNRAGYAKKGA